MLETEEGAKTEYETAPLKFHSVGGWCALIGASILGPRISKYTKDGKSNDLLLD